MPDAALRLQVCRPERAWNRLPGFVPAAPMGGIVLYNRIP